MTSFGDDAAVVAVVPAAVVVALARLDRARGRQDVRREQASPALPRLAERARVRSVLTSSALEGVVVGEPRASTILAGRASRLRTRDEQELAGLRDALDHVWRERWQPLDVGLVLHLHRLLLQHTDSPGGRLKTSDNLVVDQAPDGTRRVRFRPTPAALTPAALQSLVLGYDEQRAAGRHHPVLLVGLLVLDLLVVHPFDDGNGRVARVLTAALLADEGYDVGRYVSLDELVAETAEDYYAALLASTHGWHEREHDPWPWLRHLVDLLGRAYERLEEATSAGATTTGKRQRVVEHVLALGVGETFRMADLRVAVPDVSEGTLRNALDDLRRDGHVRVEGAGRGARWRRTGRA